MASERDTLAQLITQELDFHYGIDEDNCEPIEAGIKAGCAAALTKGWRPPAREITDPAELDALPVGSIVKDGDGDAWQRAQEGWRCPLFGAPVLPTGGLFATTESLTVLSVPTEEAGRA